ncbi:MAG: protein kinase, partial [Nitrospirota bacterium]
MSLKTPFGKYYLTEKIATGGMAELYRAKRIGVAGFEKLLVIKKILPHLSLHEEFVSMFINEAKIAAQLTHTNIAQIFDLGKIEDSYYIAMEYVWGKDLKAVLKKGKEK